MNYFMHPFMALFASGLFFMAGASPIHAGQPGSSGWSRAPSIGAWPSIPNQPAIDRSTIGKQPIGSDWWRTYPWSPYNAWQNRYWYPPYNKNYPFAPDEAYPYRPYPAPRPYPYPAPSPWGIGSGNP